jgi:hypothetical protein
LAKGFFWIAAVLGAETPSRGCGIVALSADPWDKTSMARRAFVWLLPTFLALMLAFGAALPWRGSESAAATAIAYDMEQPVDGHGVVLANGPLDGGNAAASTGQWNDDDDPDDILPASVVGISPPPLISGVGRRVGHAVVRQHLVSSAFPRGPPAA